MNFDAPEARTHHRAGSTPTVDLKYATEWVGHLLETAGHVAAMSDTEENRQAVAELHSMHATLLGFCRASGLKTRTVERVEVSL